MFTRQSNKRSIIHTRAPRLRSYISHFKQCSLAYYIKEVSQENLKHSASRNTGTENTSLEKQHDFPDQGLAYKGIQRGITSRRLSRSFSKRMKVITCLYAVALKDKLQSVPTLISNGFIDTIDLLAALHIDSFH